jgi:tRNA threonylcarbamoyladenosine modification (KEOPS) complex Cgi121 subunit
MKLDGEHVLLAGMHNLRIRDTDEFIQHIRAINSRVAVQAIDASFVADKEHILSVLQQSLQARKRGTLLSDRIEIDVLMRFACTNQISKALDDIGLKDGMNNVLLVVLGKISDLKTVKKHLEKNYRLNNNIIALSGKKTRVLASHHKVGKPELDACIGENKLASVLAERANLLW